jgi:hypothetical protein
LVVREVRALGLGSERILLRGGHIECILLPNRGAIGDPFWFVNTMVFTHIPSNLFLILAACSSNLCVTLGLLLLRSAL